MVLQKGRGKGRWRAAALRAVQNADNVENTSVGETSEEGMGYDGESNEQGEAEGRGTFRFPEGHVYVGEWKAGQAEGRGTFKWASGSVYDGEFRAGARHGRGMLRFVDGEVYAGEGNAGTIEGRGTFCHGNGDIYDGEFRAGKTAGRGKQLRTNGEAVKLTDGYSSSTAAVQLEMQASAGPSASREETRAASEAAIVTELPEASPENLARLEAEHKRVKAVLRAFEKKYEAENGSKPRKRTEWGTMWAEHVRYRQLRARGKAAKAAARAEQQSDALQDVTC